MHNPDSAKNTLLNKKKKSIAAICVKYNNMIEAQLGGLCSVDLLRSITKASSQAIYKISTQ